MAPDPSPTCPMAATHCPAAGPCLGLGGEKESFGQTKLKKSVATTEKKLRPPDSRRKHQTATEALVI
ncbi:hypothetical protein Y1Q_0013451 [Alligator mississippiensis]|uniref:Uncharacterized protein n=1 Tax=Alligator mississippiensis TaxID=8496 RepID=A0A151MSC5_ALLMI|nr:hypothetical protein Y1Q_0013451 [Alligator mississippiensis]